jgi:hypothetical protein
LDYVKEHFGRLSYDKQTFLPTAAILWCRISTKLMSHRNTNILYQRLVYLCIAEEVRIQNISPFMQRTLLNSFKILRITSCIKTDS